VGLTTKNGEITVTQTNDFIISLTTLPMNLFPGYRHCNKQPSFYEFSSVKLSMTELRENTPIQLQA
jgi:hypothetical protein